MGNKADRVQQQESVASISSLLAHGPLGVPDGGSAAPAAGSRRQSDDQHGRLPQAQFDSSTDGSGGGPARNSASFTAQTAAARAARAAAAPGEAQSGGLARRIIFLI